MSENRRRLEAAGYLFEPSGAGKRYWRPSAIGRLLPEDRAADLLLLEAAVSEKRRRHLRWMEWLWEMNTTTAPEEARMEEVLQVFRKQVKDSERGVSVREYTAEERRWGP